MGTHFSRFYHRHPRLSQLALSLFALFLISSLQHPDPTSPSFQLPGLFPSHYPASRHLSNPALNTRLTTAAANLSQACQSPIEPIHIDPGLTPAQERRYEHLRRGQGRVMVVTTIREIASQMPDFLNALIVLVTYLGPSRLSFSILEGPSDDCTAQALENVLKPTLLEMGVPERHLHLTTRESKIDFSKHNRIEVLAGLRNRALSPLWTSTSKGKGKADDAVEAVVFVNDVYLRASDVLEVLHQHKRAGAGITTAWDWMERKPEYYYDVWVGRTIDTGNLFYPIKGRSWSPSEDLFFDSEDSEEHFEDLEPFQVYSSWNGLAVLDPKPFLPPHNVRFRRGDAARGECAASECSLIATDFWKAGYGRVQIVPSVQLAYTRHSAQQTRDELVKQQAELGWKDGVPPAKRDITVAFTTKPPNKVRCHPWPEKNGLSANVWETTLWVDPLSGIS
ncbi:cryptococcal mannosyltransferase 1-domain-containing protein [Papiliotrema laurentii]|uniref:Cryptococcal mannosyltransferase 1-domain-containing protein n=1 Tax=Papiliotrema laurentii TaxID=5418 RepID=A0AAD9CX26_PAPLA|nr:cryptococcal mannosyltransferase 1-domain-containing protein [Papiliotrema laurentii]